jgi:uncharacterized SAM-binding protein YcdF (DUF218 family)
VQPGPRWGRRTVGPAVTAEPSRRIFRPKLLIVIVAVIAVLLFVAMNLGTFLYEDDPLQPADAIAALAGTVAARPLEAVDLYTRGYAPVIVITREEPEAGVTELQRRGIIVPSKAEVTRDVFLKLGVPSNAIVIPERIHSNTAQEAQTFRALAMQHGWHRIIVVTSVYHTRRAGFAIRRELKGTGINVEMHASRYEPLHPPRWWATREDLKQVLDESAKLVAYEFGLGA